MSNRAKRGVAKAAPPATIEAWVELGPGRPVTREEIYRPVKELSQRLYWLGARFDEQQRLLNRVYEWALRAHVRLGYPPEEMASDLMPAETVPVWDPAQPLPLAVRDARVDFLLGRAKGHGATVDAELTELVGMQVDRLHGLAVPWDPTPAQLGMAELLDYLTQVPDAKDEAPKTIEQGDTSPDSGEGRASVGAGRTKADLPGDSAGGTTQGDVEDPGEGAEATNQIAGHISPTPEE